MASSIDWQARLLLSLLLAVIVVFASGVTVLLLDSQRSNSGQTTISEYVFGLPLAPGWLFVVYAFGDWRAVHQGQIALVPFVSAGVDAFVIFLIWELFRWRAVRKLLSS